MPYEFQVTRRVEFSDTDVAGLMHFSNFFRFMETAEHGFFRSLGFSVLLSRSHPELGLPRVHAECDYMAPLHFEDEVLVRLLVQRKTRRTLTYQFRFTRLNASPPLEVARGVLTIVCTARQKDGSLKAVSLPKVIADKIQEAPPELLAAGVPAEQRVPVSSALASAGRRGKNNRPASRSLAEDQTPISMP